MRIVALCPSFRRARLTQNAAKCFLEQDIHPDQAAMVILEDGGALLPGRYNERIEVITSDTRYPDLGTKYNVLAENAIKLFDATHFAVWEDDDIYLSYHLLASVLAMEEEEKEWAMPSYVYHIRGDSLLPVNWGIYHATIVLSRKAWETVKWDTSGMAKFDRILMEQLTEKFGKPADPCKTYNSPTYVFRWESTKAYHGQGLMRSLEDKSWYQVVELITPPVQPVPLDPQFDPETEFFFTKYSLPKRDLPR